MRSFALSCVLIASLPACDAPTPPHPEGEGEGEGEGDVGAEGEGEGEAPAPCAEPGCVQSSQRIASLTRFALERLIDPALAIDNGYALFVIRYRTNGRDATAEVAIPDAPTPPGGFPVVVNAHGTIGLDDACRVSGTLAGAGLAGLFGARGTISVAPDYPGLGSEGRHPYLVADSESESVLDAVRAARELAASIDVEASARFAVVGLSQGGHAALSTGARQAAYAPELELRAIGVSGPASAFLPHFAAAVDVPGPHLVFHALLASAWAHEAGVDVTDALLPGIDDVLATTCVFSPAFTDEPTLVDVLPQTPAELFVPAFGSAWAAQDLTDYPWLQQAFDDNAVRPWTQQAPVRVWQGDADTTVPLAFTQELVTSLRAAGMEIELTVVPGGEHINVAFGFLAVSELATEESVAWVLEQLAP